MIGVRQSWGGEVEITCLPAGGGKTVALTDEAPKRFRSSYNMDDIVKDGRAAIMVRALDGALSW